MPCTPDMIEKAIECASEFRLNSFTATPTTVTPGHVLEVITSLPINKIQDLLPSY